MFRFLLLCLFLLVLVDGLAVAKIYRCKDAQDATVFTDDPTKFPQGCGEEQVIKLSEPNVMSSQGTPAVKPETKAAAPAQKDAPQQPEGAEEVDVYATLKSKAVDLVKRFSVARKGVYRSTLVQDKKKARRDLIKARAEKAPLLREVEKSALTRSQKSEISGILSAITE